MKQKIFYTLATFLFSLQCVQAQDFWQQVQVPDTVHVECITISIDGTIFIGALNNVKGGVYRSYDNGETWLFSYLTEYNSTVYSLLATDNQTIFAGGEGVIYRSIDGGLNWADNFNATDNIISLFESRNQNIFAGTWGYGYKSSNKGNSWNLVMSVSTSASLSINCFIETSNGYLYAAIWDFMSPQNGVYRSIDGGDNWEFFFIANDGFTSLAINSNDEIFAASYYSGLFRSSDYGATWNFIAVNTTNDILIDKNDVIYVACDASGVHRSLDNGQTWEAVNTGLTNNPAVTKFATDSNNYLYCLSGNKLYRSVLPVTASIQNTEQNNILIYPNPASNFINISLPKQVQKRIDIRVFNVFGKVIDNLTVENQNTFNYSVNQLSNGIYFIEFSNLQQKLIQKFIVTH